MTRLPQAHHTATDGAPAARRLFQRIGLVVHPKRQIDGALRTLREWGAAEGIDVVQVADSGHQRVVADQADAASCDLVVALGGDGTTLAALHAAARVDRPVLGVACGSLGALTAVNARELRGALERVAAGDWTARPLSGLEVATEDAPARVAINDAVVIRRASSQVAVEIHVDGELYARYAGDGLVIATPLGSSAYTLAAGGPVLAPGSGAFVLTPLAPHGGCCPPLAVGSATQVTVLLEPGHAGARVEIDGQVASLQLAAEEPRRLGVSWVDHYATLVGLGADETMIAGLRRRRIIIDSPRVLARDERAALGS